jgi:hypothetical protein
VARRPRAIDPQLISPRRRRDAPASFPIKHSRRRIMGKYLIGWLLGVPVFVLVILYFFFH